MKRPERFDPPDSPGSRVAGRKPVVLLVDDMEALLVAASRVLRLTCERIDTQTDARRVLEMCSARSYDVLVLDLDLGVTDGITLARQVREAGYSMPILFWTGRPAAVTAARADLGRVCVVGKPAPPGELRSRLLELFGGPSAAETFENGP